MKLQSVGYINNSNNQNITRSSKKPSFGHNPFVNFASFIERNGFMAEFLCIDASGMMIPRTAQGYLRNREELGHLNYKAGREELVRELLSGPAFFYVPLIALTAVSLLKGKSAKVSHKVLNAFKNVMKNASCGIKNPDNVRKGFIDSFRQSALAEYKHGDNLVNRLTALMEENLTTKVSLKDRFFGFFKSSANKPRTQSVIRKEAVDVMTRLNKMNGKMLDNADSVMLNGQSHNISDLFSDMSNYLDDFTSKAMKTTSSKSEFIESFHKTAGRVRDLANAIAIGSLSTFLLVIPKLYQTGKDFPGVDGLKGNSNTTGKAVENANK